MCTNLQPIPDESAIVYKIVARKKKGTRYYSIAMGFKYPKITGRIPEIKVQHRLGYFTANLLNKASSTYKTEMCGRTAGFVNRCDAYREARIIRHNHDMSKNYYILIVKAELTDGLMSGTYDGLSVIAGQHIEFLE